jgi:hypothetical protein
MEIPARGEEATDSALETLARSRCEEGDRKGLVVYMNPEGTNCPTAHVIIFFLVFRLLF